MEIKMLIALTDTDDMMVLVNQQQVTTTLKYKEENFTRIYFVNGEIKCIYVKETPEEIYAKFKFNNT